VSVAESIEVLWRVEECWCSASLLGSLDTQCNHSLCSSLRTEYETAGSVSCALASCIKKIALLLS
jgi:hypothetical protein